MNYTLLRHCASRLERMLEIYAATDSEAAALWVTLNEYLEKANAGTLTDPLGRGSLPGGRYFTEGTLRKYRDLETAYRDFAVEATGGESPALRALRKEMGEI
jgi:hypothetical protein